MYLLLALLLRQPLSSSKQGLPQQPLQLGLQQGI
jgi:hypothetical protein